MKFTQATLTTIMTLGLAVPAAAQNTGNQDTNRWNRDQGNQYDYGVEEDNNSRILNDRRSGNWNQNRGQNQQSWSGNQGQNQSRTRTANRQGQNQQGQNMNLQLDPQGFVTIAYDYDQDGRVDAYESIYAYDLERARAQSRQRQGQQGRQQSQRWGQQQGQRQGQQSQRWNQGQQRTEQMSQRQGQQARQVQRTVQGTIENLKAVQLNGMDERTQLARIQTNDGRLAKVALGPESRIQRLNLQEGDKVKVHGYSGRINNRSILVAQKVTSPDSNRSVSTNMQDTKRTRAVDGRVMNTRTVNLQGQDNDFVIADVRTDDGQRHTVVLGPENRTNRLNLEQGDDLFVLATPARLNDNKALIATKAHANNRVVTFQRDGQQDRSMAMGNRQGQRNQQRGDTWN
ncbi:MAG: hypothetical protein RLY93_18740 [Sumerlaeia bacterium]